MAWSWTPNKDYKDSKLPVREEPSAWDPEARAVALHHTEEDKAAHIRAYMKPTMEITKCHEDVQQGGGTDSRNGAVLHYIATYGMKFSSSMDSEWLSGEGSDYSTAVGVLRRIRLLGAGDVAYSCSGALPPMCNERQHVRHHGPELRQHGKEAKVRGGL